MAREIQPPDRSLPQSGSTDAAVLSALLRYRDRHRWSWNLSARLINLYYGTRYTEKQLKSLYKAHAQQN